jgi:hypothetical protein
VEGHEEPLDLRPLGPFLRMPAVYSVAGCRRTAPPEVRRANELSYFNSDGVATAWINGSGFGVSRARDLRFYSAMIPMGDRTGRDTECVELVGHPGLTQMHLSGGVFGAAALDRLCAEPPPNLRSATIPFVEEGTRTQRMQRILGLVRRCGALRELRVVVRGDVDDEGSLELKRAADAVLQARMRLRSEVALSLAMTKGDAVFFEAGPAWGDVLERIAGDEPRHSFTASPPALVQRGRLSGDGATRAANEAMERANRGLIEARGDPGAVDEVIRVLEEAKDVLTVFELDGGGNKRASQAIATRLTQCRALTHLVFSNQPVDTIPLGALMGLPALALLDLTGTGNEETRASAETVRGASRQLRYLYISRCDWITNDFLGAIGGLPNLKVLAVGRAHKLSHSAVATRVKRGDGDLVPSLGALLPNLRGLFAVHLWKFPRADPAVLSRFFAQNPELGRVDGLYIPADLLRGLIARPIFKRYYYSHSRNVAHLRDRSYPLAARVAMSIIRDPVAEFWALRLRHPDKILVEANIHDTNPS